MTTEGKLVMAKAVIVKSTITEDSDTDICYKIFLIHDKKLTLMEIIPVE